MKFSQELLKLSEESDLAKSNKMMADLQRAHKTAKSISAARGVVQHINQNKNTKQIYVSDWYDDDETIGSYNNGKWKDSGNKLAESKLFDPKDSDTWDSDEGDEKETMKQKPKKSGGQEPTDFDNWLSRNKIASEDDLYDIIDNAYNQDTYASYLADNIKKAMKKAKVKSIKDFKPQALKLITDTAIFAVTGSGVGAKKAKAAAPKFAKEVLSYLMNNMDLYESADLAKKLVRGEKFGSGIMNKINQFITWKLMFKNGKNRFLPADQAVKQLKVSGFSNDQIHKIRDVAAEAGLAAMEYIKKKYPKEVPAKYAKPNETSFQVYDLYLNVGEDIREEFSEMFQKLFDKKIEKIKDALTVKESLTEGREDIGPTADKCEEGDIVAITGNVEHEGDTGEITKFGTDKKFVVVKLFKDNKEYSFHSSDVTKETDEDADKDEGDDDEDGIFDQDEQDTFYVAFYDEDDEKSWIGEVTKRGGGKWHEKPYKGKPDYRWGTSYMSYLKPEDVMSWIHKDYRRGMEVEGPFDTAEEAEEYVSNNFGGINESVTEAVAEKESTLTKANLKSNLEDTLEDIVKEYSKHAKAGQTSVPSAPNTMAFKAIKYGMIELAPGTIVHGAYGTSSKFDLFVKVGGQIPHAIFKAMVDDLKRDVGYITGKTVKGDNFVIPTSDGYEFVFDTTDGSAWSGFGFRIRKTYKESVTEGAVKVDPTKSALDNLEAFAGKKLKTGRVVICGYPVDIAGDSDKDTIDYSAVDKGTGTDLMKLLRAAGYTVKRFGDTEFQATVKKQVKESDDYSRDYGAEETARKETDKFQAAKKNALRLKDKEKMDFNRMMAGAMSRDEFNKKWKKGKYAVKSGKYKLDPTGMYHNVIKTMEGTVNEESYTDFDDWKAAVLNSYPQQAKKIKFKGRMEGGKDTISAEVPGEDRSYGVWDADKERGVVLSEAGPFSYGAKKPRKGSVAYNIAMKRKEEENKPENIKKTEKIGSKNHMVGTTKVIPVEEGKEENIAKLRKDYKDALGWVDMAMSDKERRGHEATVHKIWNHAKNQYKIDLNRKDGKLDEGFSPYKPNARVKIISGPKDVVGKEGTIGEVQTDVGGKKSYTIDYDHDEKSGLPNFGAKSIRLKPENIKLIKA